MAAVGGTSRTEGTESTQNEEAAGTSSSISNVKVTERHLWITHFIHPADLDVHCLTEPSLRSLRLLQVSTNCHRSFCLPKQKLGALSPHSSSYLEGGKEGGNHQTPGQMRKTRPGLLSTNLHIHISGLSYHLRFCP